MSVHEVGLSNSVQEIVSYVESKVGGKTVRAARAVNNAKGTQLLQTVDGIRSSQEECTHLAL